MSNIVRADNAVNAEAVLKAIQFEGNMLVLNWNGVIYKAKTVAGIFDLMAGRGLVVLPNDMYELSQLNGWVYWF